MLDQNSDEEVDLRDYIKVIVRRRKTFIIVSTSVFFCVALYSFSMKPVYEAAATLHVKEEKGVLKGTMLADLSSVNPIDAEIQIVQSRTNAENVVKQLHLDWKISNKSKDLDFQVLEFTSSAKKPVYTIHVTGPDTYKVKDNDGEIVGSGQSGNLMQGKGITLFINKLHGKAGDRFKLELLPFNGTVGNLQKTIKVKEVGRKSNIIEISYTNTDPVLVRDVVNTLVQAYLGQSVGFKTEEANRTVGFVEGQLKDIQNELDSSEKNLQTFKSKSQTINLDTEAQTLIQTLADKEKQKTDIALQRKQVEFALASLKKARQRGLVYSPAVMNDDPTIIGLAAKLAELSVQKNALLVENTELHPSVKAVQGEIDELQQEIQATYETSLRNLTRQLAEMKQQLAVYENKLKGLPLVEQDLARLTRFAKVNADIYTFLLQKREEAKMVKASTISNIDIVDPAIIPDNPIKPIIPKYLLLGLFLGCMFGVLVAFFEEFLDDTIKDADGARRAVELPLLAIIPHFETAPATVQGNGSLRTLKEPKSQFAEAFRSLRTSLHFSAINRDKKVILVTSTFPGEGKSTISANLANIFTQTGSRVLLIDCDLRRSSLHEKFHHSKAPGLSEILTGDATIEDAVHNTDIPGLRLVSAGTTPPNPSELLGSAAMQRFLEQERVNFDHIVIDAPPVLAVTDAPILTATADMVIVIMEAGRVPLKAAQRMREMLTAIKAPVAGLVMNDKSGKGETYGYHYGKYYQYGYYSDDGQTANGNHRWWTRLLKARKNKR